MQLKDCLGHNIYSDIVYSKPIYNDRVRFPKLKYKRKERKFYRKTVKPMIEELRHNSPSFSAMCDFADFIKQMEMVIQYKNCILSSSDKVQLVCDNDIRTRDKKVLILISPNNYTARFAMKIDHDDEIIEIRIVNEFGKKLTTSYRIVNAEASFESVHENNLLNNVNNALKEAMADVFKTCYDMII